MSPACQRRRRLVLGLAFLTPNIAGFAVFTLLPLVVSCGMAFTNWDIRLHNIFQQEPLRFVGLANFVRLLREPDFYRYFGNTLFFMLGLPFGIAGSLAAALLLSQELRGTRRRVWLFVMLTCLLVAGLLVTVAAGLHATALTLLLCGLAGLILCGGAAGGQTVYRTLFYFPHFTAGVATFLLWKKLYSPHTGPLNHALRPLLAHVAQAVQAVPASAVQRASWLASAGALAVLAVGLRSLRGSWRDGETGGLALVVAALLLLGPGATAPLWHPCGTVAWMAALGVVPAAGLLAYCLLRPRPFSCSPDTGLGRSVVLGGAVLVAQLALLGASAVIYQLPAWSGDGLQPPDWLTEYGWAKPSLMIMGLWAAVGSNNMLLYLAGLSNIPPELQEAAEIDGAGRIQRFWHVTWPQLAPVTFFITVMAVIGGLQGGFEMARTMTQGGPAGATTTLSYYVYTEGFQDGRLGYASAAAWTLFALVFAVTLFNWRFGNRYVND